MFRKLSLLLGASLLLGGCTLGSLTSKPGDAATDAIATTTPSPVAVASASPVADPELDKMPATSQSTDIDSIESDLNNTNILNEDFSDIK
jgi:hypothetical protein